MKKRISIAAFTLLCLFTVVQFYSFVSGIAVFKGAGVVNRPATGSNKTDAIVVLTGGQGRVETGLALLRAGKSEKLILSGVNSESSHDAIFRNRLVKGEKYRIILEKRSRSTYENALEVKRLVEKLHIESITLITSSYHMKRAYATFSHLLPRAVKVVPYTISTPNFDEENLWAPDNIVVTLPEFIKYYWYEIRYNIDSGTA